jgi:hypothetical protein
MSRLVGERLVFGWSNRRSLTGFGSLHWSGAMSWNVAAADLGAGLLGAPFLRLCVGSHGEHQRHRK